MDDHEDRNVVAAHRAVKHRNVRFRTFGIVAALLLAGIVYFVSIHRAARTTTADGRNIESPATALSGARR
jgi:hypothetical protein